MGLKDQIELLETEILRLRWQVEALPEGSLDHARLANTLRKHYRDHDAALRLLDGRYST